MSSQTTNQKVHFEAIMNGSEERSGVEHGQHLLAFAEAVFTRDGDAIRQAREALRTAAGPGAMVDAAGVIANFHRMTRIADTTGITLDQRMVQISADLRGDLGIDRFAKHSADRD